MRTRFMVELLRALMALSSVEGEVPPPSKIAAEVMVVNQVRAAGGLR